MYANGVKIPAFNPAVHDVVKIKDLIAGDVLCLRGRPETVKSVSILDSGTNIHLEPRPPVIGECLCFNHALVEVVIYKRA